MIPRSNLHGRALRVDGGDEIPVAVRPDQRAAIRERATNGGASAEHPVELPATLMPAGADGDGHDRVVVVDGAHDVLGALPVELAEELYTGLLTLSLLSPPYLVVCPTRIELEPTGTDGLRATLLTDLDELHRLAG